MNNYDVANEENSLPVCRQFVANATFDETFADCQVCGHLEFSHPEPGRRALNVPTILALRQSLIDASVSRYGVDT